MHIFFLNDNRTVSDLWGIVDDNGFIAGKHTVHYLIEPERHDIFHARAILIHIQ